MNTRVGLRVTLAAVPRVTLGVMLNCSGASGLWAPCVLAAGTAGAPALHYCHWLVIRIKKVI